MFTFQKNVNLRSLRNKKQFLSQPPKCFYIAKKCPSTYMRHKSSNFLTIHLAKWVEIGYEVLTILSCFYKNFLEYIDTYANPKGQLISKGHLVVFNSLKKNENKST